MISRSWCEILSLVLVIPLAIILPSSTTAFVTTNVRYSARREFCHEPRNNYFSYALAAGGFGKAPTGKPSKNKKRSKKKQKKTATAIPPYIPFESYPDNLVSGSNDMGSPSPQQQTRALLDWLDEEEVEGLDGVEIGFSKLGSEISANDNDVADGFLRGVFARQDFRVGEYIMAVPFVTTILLDENFEATSDPGKTVLRANEAEVGFQFWEKFFYSNPDGKNEAFLDCLPMSPEDPNFDGTPDFWSEKDIRQLEIPKVIDTVLSRKVAIGNLLSNNNRVLENGNDDNGNKESGALSTIQQCCWLVQSRAFTTYKKAIDLLGNEGFLSRVVMIPFIDMINHDSPKFANVEMQVVETKEYDESFYALVATQSIPKGEEIKISYGTGKETSVELFCRYGFLPKVEDREREKEALGNLLEGVEWSTTLEEDQAMLATQEGSKEPMRTILSIRIYAKDLFS
mmetsp:Transcript_12224/g.25756  ORF Transcript_12224/g.25756 Transcript_12224/m.25756 type:complete len:456 (-) Transcript_12224:1628-2995(-)